MAGVIGEVTESVPAEVWEAPKDETLLRQEMGQEELMMLLSFCRSPNTWVSS